MSLHVDIRRDFGGFRLSAAFDAEAETLALLGASGCGKSVTLRCIAGILRPDEGRIVLDGQVLYDSAARIDLPPQRRRVGYLFQQYALFPNMTVSQNVAAAVRDKGLRAARTAELLERFQLSELAARRPRALSGGQQQRTALARILASEPRAILLDEPFSALDSYLKYQLELDLAETLDRFPGTAVWVSHDRGEVWRNCRRVCLMESGSSLPVRTMEDLFQSPGTVSAARLSGCKNYGAASVDGDYVNLPQWGLRLRHGQDSARGADTVGIRSHHLRFADEGDENAFSCRVVRVIDDVFGMIVLLRPEGAGPDAPLLRMELEKGAWAAGPKTGRITVSVAPRDILLLR